MANCCYFATTFFLVLLHRISGQTECERCSYEGHVFDRLVEMQVEMRELKRDMEMLKASVNSNREQVSDDMAAFTRSLITFNNTLKKVTTPMIAFDAYNPTDSTPQQGQIIVFGRVSLNVGGGYDASFGMFTAPVRGLYCFTVHLCHATGKYMIFSIYVDATQLAVSQLYENSGVSCGSVSTLALIEIGQRITVRGAYDPNQLHDSTTCCRGSFSGHLLSS